MEHFQLGWITGVLSYLVSVIGCMIGLACTTRAQFTRTVGQSARWLLLAAVGIGGAGIWLMHFIAMLGFSVNAEDGNEVLYDPASTALSAVFAVAIVGAGLLFVGIKSHFLRWPRLILAGILTGSGVAVMHYTGMSAVLVQGRLEYGRNMVIASVVIAIVAATVALWLSLVLRSPVLRALAAPVMGAAVWGMHYTGMAAVEWVPGDASTAPVDGMTLAELMVPIVVAASVLLTVPLYLILTTEAPELAEDLPVWPEPVRLPERHAPPPGFRDSQGPVPQRPRTMPRAAGRMVRASRR